MKGATIFVMYADGNGNVTISARDGGPGHVQPLENTSLQGNVQLLEGSGIVNGQMVANIFCGFISPSFVSWWKLEHFLIHTLLRFELSPRFLSKRLLLSLYCSLATRVSTQQQLPISDNHPTRQ